MRGQDQSRSQPEGWRMHTRETPSPLTSRLVLYRGSGRSWGTPAVYRRDLVLSLPRGDVGGRSPSTDYQPSLCLRKRKSPRCAPGKRSYTRPRACNSGQVARANAARSAIKLGSIPCIEAPSPPPLRPGACAHPVPRANTAAPPSRASWRTTPRAIRSHNLDQWRSGAVGTLQ